MKNLNLVRTGLIIILFVFIYLFVSDFIDYRQERIDRQRIGIYQEEYAELKMEIEAK